MKILKFLLLGFAVVFAISCGKDEAEPEMTINDLVGSWKATSSMVTSHLNSGDQIELISNGGEIRFTMLTGGRVRTWFTFGSFSDEWDALATLSGNTLTTTPVEASRGVFKARIVLENDVLTMTNENASFDFTLSGQPEVGATTVTVFVRN